MRFTVRDYFTEGCSMSEWISVNRCCAWTEYAGRCSEPSVIGTNTCLLHDNYYTEWWQRNPPISNAEWMRSQVDMRDSLEQHMFQLREGHVAADAERQNSIAELVLSDPRGSRSYTHYYKSLLKIKSFNPILCERMLDPYIGTCVEDFLYYRFLGRSLADSVLYAETLFKEVIYCQHIYPEKVLQILSIVLVLLKGAPRASEYYNGASWKEVCARSFDVFLRLPVMRNLVLCGRTCRDLLDWFCGGWVGSSLIESWRTEELRSIFAEVRGALEGALSRLWRVAALERVVIFKEDLVVFTSHPAWFWTRCVDSEELADFDETPEEIWANGVRVAGPFYLRAVVAKKN
jgi:hypothetical protein